MLNIEDNSDHNGRISIIIDRGTEMQQNSSPIFA
jgi:hypothetical protein